MDNSLLWQVYGLGIFSGVLAGIAGSLWFYILEVRVAKADN